MARGGSNYSPSARYNPPADNPTSGPQSSGPGRLSSSAGGGILPHQVQGNPNIWRIAAILDGAKDDRYTYKFTALPSTGPISIKFAHGLSFAPNVQASFFAGESYNQAGQYPLPYFHWDISSTNYFSVGSTPPAGIVHVQRVDKTHIYVNIVIGNALLLSFLLANYPLKFKFICFQESIVT